MLDWQNPAPVDIRGCRVLYIKWKSTTECNWCNLKKPMFPRAGLHRKLNQTGMKNLNGKNQHYYHSIKSYWSISGFRFSSNGTQTFPTSPWWLRDLARDDGKYSPAGSAPSKKETSRNLHVSNFLLLRSTVIRYSDSNGRECHAPQRQATTPTWSWPMLQESVLVWFHCQNL